MKLSLSRDLEEISRIVTATRAWFAEQHIPNSLAFPVDLATEELFVNMIRHNPAKSERIMLEMDTVEHGVTVQLTDYDVDRFDPRSAPVPDINAPLSERAIGGLGLHLVANVVTALDYDYRDRTSTIRFTALENGHRV